MQFSIVNFGDAYLFASELPDDPYVCTNPAQTFASKSKPGCQVLSQVPPPLYQVQAVIGFPWSGN